MVPKILSFFTFCLALSGSNISFYFDRVPTLEAQDYLVFHVKNDFQDKKIYYKLPHSLSHKESF